MLKTHVNNNEELKPLNELQVLMSYRQTWFLYRDEFGETFRAAYNKTGPDKAVGHKLGILEYLI